MIVVEYVHYGESEIRTFAYQQYEDKFEWSFNDGKIHCGDKKSLDLVIETIRHNSSIINVHEDDTIRSAV